MATCFGSSEPSSGQYSIYRYGECSHYRIPLVTIWDPIMCALTEYSMSVYWVVSWRWFTRTEICCQICICDNICAVIDWINYFISTKLATTTSGFLSWCITWLWPTVVCGSDRTKLALLENVWVLLGSCGQKIHMFFVLFTKCSILSFVLVQFLFPVLSGFCGGHLKEIMSMRRVTYQLFGKFFLTALSERGGINWRIE